MKTNSAVFLWRSSIVFMATTIAMSIAIAPAQAQIDPRITSGLFTSTQSQRFYEAGRDDLLRELEILSNREQYFGDDLLKINPKLIEQMSNLDLSSNLD